MTGNEPLMLILCDFDGTVTCRDTNSYLAERFSRPAFEAVEGLLAGRVMALRDVLSAELGAMTASTDEIVQAAIDEIPFRAGFADFVSFSRARAHELVLLSAGFRQIITPMLQAAGQGETLTLIANDVEFDGVGGRITWRDVPVCGHCGEHCKRWDVERLRGEHDATTVVYIGDGFSDRCGAETADLIFARAALATYLDELGVEFTYFDDFHTIAATLDQQ